MFLNTIKIQNQHLIKVMVKKWINLIDLKTCNNLWTFLVNSPRVEEKKQAGIPSLLMCVALGLGDKSS